MNEQYYDTIFKRKSFHLFRGVGAEKLSEKALADIEKAYAGFEPLIPGIHTAIRIVPSDVIGSKKDAEYCILIYSEKKENWLMNAGYLGQQLDLYLTAQNIGSLWYGYGKPDLPQFDGLEFVIMFAVRKVSDETKYRKDMFKAKRKALNDIWSGDGLGVAEIARFAPSAVNSQPWYVENADGTLTVFRYKKQGGFSIISSPKITYFNCIDIGIYLCILEICMAKQGIAIKRTLFADDGSDRELTKVAEYTLN